jgi:5'/3'-nucleotidase
MPRTPHILIGNDDGIYAAGLRALVEAVKDLGTVSIVAPSQERSGAAQSLTLRQPIFCERVAEREWSIEGTPTDAMIVALHRLFPPPQRPDLVISGINGGANMGENVFYSGTVGAAMEAAINHVPALAVSVAHHGPDIDYQPAAQFTRRLAEVALSESLPAGMLLNVNVPLHWKGGVRFTRQSRKVTRNVLREGSDPRGRTYYWLSEQQMVEELDPESDYAAVLNGDISITPLELDRTHEASINHLSHWAKLLERSPAR